MKKAILTFIISICISSIGKAQAIGDTIISYIENQIELKVIIEDFDKLRHSNQLVNDLENFQRHFSALEVTFELQEAELITYTPDSLITVEKIIAKSIYLIQDSSPINTGIRDKVVIHSKNTIINMTTSDLNNLKGVDFSGYLKKVIAQLPEKTRFSKSLYFQCKNNEVTSLEEKNTTNSEIDAIELTASAGVGLFKNQWIGDFTFRLGFSLNKKGAIDYFPYLTANLMYDFPSSNRTNINTFLSLGYQWTLKSTKMRAEFGYLVSRQGGLFDENTFRFGLNWSPADAISVSPQIYFSDGFKKVTPGLRIGFGF